MGTSSLVGLAPRSWSKWFTSPSSLTFLSKKISSPLSIFLLFKYSSIQMHILYVHCMRTYIFVCIYVMYVHMYDESTLLKSCSVSICSIKSYLLLFLILQLEHMLPGGRSKLLSFDMIYLQARRFF